MRTTISLNDGAENLLVGYREAYSRSFRKKITASKAIADSLEIGIPILLERLQQAGEDEEEWLLRRARNLQQKVTASDVTGMELAIYMREAIQLQEDCRSLLFDRQGSATKADVERYQRVLQAALEVYGEAAMIGNGNPPVVGRGGSNRRIE
jgi:hypothetical protein